MLETRQELEGELVNRLMAANNSAIFPAPRITELIAQANKWAGSLYFWPPLKRARTTFASGNTQSLAYDYYDYPTDFLQNSISRLYIDGKRYDPKTFQTFLDYVDAPTDTAFKPDNTKRYFSSYGRQYFVFPTYSGTSLTRNLIVWGNVQPPELINPTDTTIFALWDDAGNEAIIQKAFSVAMYRLESNLAAAAKQDAIQLLAVMWKKVTDEMQKEQPLHHPMFQIPNFFQSTGGTAAIGNFNTDVTIGS